MLSAFSVIVVSLLLGFTIYVVVAKLSGGEPLWFLFKEKIILYDYNGEPKNLWFILPKIPNIVMFIRLQKLAL